MVELIFSVRQQIWKMKCTIWSFHKLLLVIKIVTTISVEYFNFCDCFLNAFLNWLIIITKQMEKIVLKYRKRSKYHKSTIDAKNIKSHISFKLSCMSKKELQFNKEILRWRVLKLIGFKDSLHQQKEPLPSMVVRLTYSSMGINVILYIFYGRK